MSQRLGQWLRLVVAWSSLATALALVLVWIGNFALGATPQEVGAPLVLESLDVLGWFELGTSSVAILGLAVGVWFHKPLWARGVALVMIGLALHWGWWIIDRTVDVFSLGTLDPSDPQLLQRVSIRFWLTFALDLVALPCLIIGGIALLRHPLLDPADLPPALSVDELPEPAELPQPDEAELAEPEPIPQRLLVEPEPDPDDSSGKPE